MPGDDLADRLRIAQLRQVEGLGEVRDALEGRLDLPEDLLHLLEQLRVDLHVLADLPRPHEDQIGALVCGKASGRGTPRAVCSGAWPWGTWKHQHEDMRLGPRGPGDADLGQQSGRLCAASREMHCATSFSVP